MRQEQILRDFDPGRGASIASLAYEYPAGFFVPEHAHGSDQLIYATQGVMEVHSGQSLWLIPPSFAIWVPARARHTIRMPAAVSMRTLYIRPRMVERAGSACSVLSVKQFFRELILEAVRLGKLRSRLPEHRALCDLILLQIARATPVPAETRMPRESRALAIALQIMKRLSQSPSLQTLCTEVGVSTRTLQRLFRHEVGVDVDSWRRQVRLTKAVELLLSGDSVKQVAASVGYQQPSAFVAAFRRTYGVTPRAWVEQVSRA
jgi:AraC-like DNA-binding protein